MADEDKNEKAATEEPTKDSAAPPQTKEDQKPAEENSTPDTKDAKGTPIVSGETELEEKQVKRAFIDKFRKKKGGNKKDEASSSVTPAEPGSPDEVAERIYQQLAHNETQEYFVLKLKKKRVLGFFGLIIFVLWVGFFVNYFMEARGLAYPWESGSDNEAIEASASANVVTEEDTGVRIRIRNIAGDEEGAVQLAQFLQSKGYSAVEVLEDSESEFDGVAIVVKPDDTQIRGQLEPIVGEMYTISSPSAELTADSDFDAVILYAPATRAEAGGASVQVQESTNSETATGSSETNTATGQ